MAIKVVGVGSVGTRCFVMLLQGRDQRDPLFLQVKEASRSVLEEHLGPSVYDNPGRRVVEGQRAVQAQSDIFLGWATGREQRGFYIRQLRDWKGSAPRSPAAAPTGSGSTPGSVAARSRAATPRPVTPSRSRRTPAPATRSTGR